MDAVGLTALTLHTYCKKTISSPEGVLEPNRPLNSTSLAAYAQNPEVQSALEVIIYLRGIHLHGSQVLQRYQAWPRGASLKPPSNSKACFVETLPKPQSIKRQDYISRYPPFCVS